MSSIAKGQQQSHQVAGDVERQADAASLGSAAAPSMISAAMASLGRGLLQRKIARRFQRRNAFNEPDGQSQSASAPDGSAAHEMAHRGEPGEHADRETEHAAKAHATGDDEQLDESGHGGEPEETETEDGDSGAGDSSGDSDSDDAETETGIAAKASPFHHAEHAATAPESGAHVGQAASSSASASTGSGATAAVPLAAKPTLTSATQKAAPGGAASTRTTVGVGEVVDFTGSAAGTWKATKGTLAAAGGPQLTSAWTAPDKPGTTTISLKVGKKSATKKMKVIAPKKLSMVYASSHGLTAGVAGVCMVTNVTIGPGSVSFGNVEWLEVPGPATGVNGYFKQFGSATLHHNPNPSWLKWDDSNTGLTDHAAWHSVPAPYKKGAFRWIIPNKYRVAGLSTEKRFTTTTQQFKMTDKLGTMSVSKAGAHISRTP